MSPKDFLLAFVTIVHSIDSTMPNGFLYDAFLVSYNRSISPLLFKLNFFYFSLVSVKRVLQVAYLQKNVFESGERNTICTDFELFHISVQVGKE